MIDLCRCHVGPEAQPTFNDVIAALTDSVNPADYIKKMRSKDKEFAKGWGQIVTPLLVDTSGGKQKINCANTEGILRIIQIRKKRY